DLPGQGLGAPYLLGRGLHVALLGWEDASGLQGVYLDECGEFRTATLLGRVRVRYQDLIRANRVVAFGAACSNSTDPSATLSLVRRLGGAGTDHVERLQALLPPGEVWLGVEPGRDWRQSGDVPPRPAWLLPPRLFEHPENFSDHACLGYAP